MVDGLKKAWPGGNRHHPLVGIQAQASICALTYCSEVGHLYSSGIILPVSGWNSESADGVAIMKALPLEPLKYFFYFGFVVSLIVGAWLFKNSGRWFSVDPDKPAETSGERTYSKAQMFICWLIVVKLFAMLALMV